MARASMTVAFVSLDDDPVNDRATPQVPASPRLTIGAPPGAAELADSVIGEDFVDRASSASGKAGIGLQIVGERDQSERQRPAESPRPGRVLDRQRCAEWTRGFRG